MIKKIVKDTFFLQQKAQPATKKDLWIGQDLQDTLAYYRDSCLGLAANMIGENKRVIIVSMDFVDLVMFNPVLTAKCEAFEAEESCLSLTGQRRTKRYQEIKVDYLDTHWHKKSLRLTGLPAQICQHELDHLEGILI
ncbi:TPA: peptide deformylase [Streptococcus equi subsp. zooepidemicus]|uniref:peptide deformylase n=1 Tax=Streptococcus equi TaxID=1336 RepID=UPI001E4702D0|nr:peptide deformylase [Streptococcus equi]MCD3372703.1 peptide deformylase [Streptococcus equi subsp. zooepidemicus]HEL0577352.1 peptide deformylase [Streptococcus equi subsp. zooepidemicus]HEL0794396.1 peptide deformylase [Streptococcus equi subsp. zooepidemicus]HEL0796010.1 peptide deformylase [Streptococcus equi subsp. zooepidemicus]